MSWRKEQRRAERGYHHGNLKEALLQAALGLIAEKGAAGFTFADAARMADASHARGISERKPGRAFFRDQPERRLQQRLFQIAVMIAALGAALFLAPAHVKGFYMRRAQRSLGCPRLSKVAKC